MVLVGRMAPGRSPANSNSSCHCPRRLGTARKAPAHLSPLFFAGSHFLSLQPRLSLCSLVQVDSLSVTPGPLGVPELIVSQPGCAYAVLLCTWNKDTGHSATSDGTTEGSR